MTILTAVPVFAQPQQRRKAYTVMVYMTGSDLERENGAAGRDIEEMTNVISSSEGILDKNLNLIIEYGGCAAWNYPPLAEANALHGRFELTAEGVKNLTPLKPANMGEADTLCGFLDYGITQYPAERYILIFWDHGEGPVMGYGYDELYDGDSLTLTEIDDAFDRSIMKQYAFELVGFDACLMGSMETAYLMPENVSYLAASAAPEPMEGWNYEWLSVLEDSDVSGADIGARIADSYMEHYEQKKETLPLTLNIWNCQAAKPFADELAFLLQLQCQDEGSANYFERINTLRPDFYGYDGQYCVQRFPQLIDYQNLAESIYAGGRLRLQKLDALCREAVCYSRTLNVEEAVSGISVFLPGKTNPFLDEDLKVYQTIPFSSLYQEFTNSYAQFMKNGSPQDSKSNRIEERNGEISLYLEEIGDYSSAIGLTCLHKDEMIQILSETDDLMLSGSSMTFTPSQDILLINGSPFYGRLLEDTGAGSEYLCPVLYQNRPYHLYIRFMEHSKTGILLGIYPLEPAGGKSDTDMLDRGGSMVPLYPAFSADEDGNYSNVPFPGSVQIENITYKKGTSLQFQTAENLRITFGKKSQSNLCYGFCLTDIRQNEYYYFLTENHT